MDRLQDVIGWVLTVLVLACAGWGVIWAFDQSVLWGLLALILLFAVLSPFVVVFSVYRLDVADHKEW